MEEIKARVVEIARRSYEAAKGFGLGVIQSVFGEKTPPAAPELEQIAAPRESPLRPGFKYIINDRSYSVAQDLLPLPSIFEGYSGTSIVEAIIGEVVRPESVHAVERLYQSLNTIRGGKHNDNAWDRIFEEMHYKIFASHLAPEYRGVGDDERRLAIGMIGLLGSFFNNSNHFGDSSYIARMEAHLRKILKENYGYDFDGDISQREVEFVGKVLRKVVNGYNSYELPAGQVRRPDDFSIELLYGDVLDRYPSLLSGGKPDFMKFVSILLENADEKGVTESIPFVHDYMEREIAKYGLSIQTRLRLLARLGYPISTEFGVKSPQVMDAADIRLTKGQGYEASLAFHLLTQLLSYYEARKGIGRGLEILQVVQQNAVSEMFRKNFAFQGNFQSYLAFGRIMGKVVDVLRTFQDRHGIIHLADLDRAVEGSSGDLPRVLLENLDFSKLNRIRREVVFAEHPPVEFLKRIGYMLPFDQQKGALRDLLLEFQVAGDIFGLMLEEQELDMREVLNNRADALKMQLGLEANLRARGIVPRDPAVEEFVMRVLTKVVRVVNRYDGPNL